MHRLEDMHGHAFIDLTSRSHPVDPRLRFTLYASFGIAILLAVTSLGGLLLPATYSRETENWAVQAIAQDWFDLFVVAPALAVAAFLALRGSRRAQLALAGLLLFTVYTLLIYAFAVHLNSLFLVYCAGLGLALYALIGFARAFEPGVVITWFANAPRRAAGGLLIGVGTAFGLLWLLQLVPSAITGRDPADLVETGLLTNPIHVIDLSFILPLHILAGVQLWRRRPLGYLLGPVVLVFGAFMSASIGFLMLVMELRGVASGGLPVAVAMALVAASTVTLAIWMLKRARE